MGVDFLGNLTDEAGAEVAGPGEAVDVFGEEGFDMEGLLFAGVDDGGILFYWVGGRDVHPTNDGCSFGEVAEGGGEGPGFELGGVVAEAGEAEFGLDATLGAHEFVPLVDDDALEILEKVTRVFVGEEEGEGFRGGDEGEGGLFANFLFAVGGGVAGACFGGEVRGEFGEGFAEGGEGILG